MRQWRAQVLSSFVVMAVLLGWGVTARTSPRVLSQAERIALTGSTFYYCSTPYPTGNACDNCVMSIYYDWVWAYGQWINVQLYQNCTPKSSSWCYQSAYATQPNPTCDLTTTTCSGNITLYLDGLCANADPYDPVQPCSLFASAYPSYKSATVGSANGVDCSAMGSALYTE